MYNQYGRGGYNDDRGEKRQSRSNNDYPQREWTNSNRNPDRNYRSGRDERDYGNDYNTGNNANEDDLVIYVQPQYVGKIIGRAGATIKNLQSQSEARINIDKSSVGDVAVTVSGSRHAQNKAQALIKELIEDNYSGSQSQRQNQDYNSTSQQNSYHSTDSYNRSSDNRSDQSSSNFSSRNKYGNQQESANSNYSNTDKPDTGTHNWATADDDFDWSTANSEHEKWKKERIAQLTPLVKNFYHEDPEVASLPEQKVAEIRKSKNNIECRRVFLEQEDPEDTFKILNPILTFEQAFRDYPEILEEIRKQGFKEPSPIQSQAWPILLSGKDMIGIAQTGTGKTLAFLLPALIHIDGQSVPRAERVGPNVLIMAPTRELALQIFNEVKKYEYRGIKATCLYGGGNRRDQISSVEKGVNIVIATPGRLNDLVAAEKLNVSEVSYLVLDEADRMLDMGFEPQIRKTLLDVRPDRQTVMTSATWPQGVRRLAQSYMQDPIQVFVGSLDLAAVHSVRQTILIVDESEKTQYLEDFFKSMGEDDKAIIFFGKKIKVDSISSELALSGINVQSIHGGRDQLDREQALADLKAGTVKILLATDVASRGIDIEDVTHVFNYDFPRDIEEYVHRVGRTGRAGRTGESISLVTRGDWSLAKELIGILEEANQEVPAELHQMSERYEAWKLKRADENDMARRDARGGRGGGGRYGDRGGGRGGAGGRGGRGGGRNQRNDNFRSFY